MNRSDEQWAREQDEQVRREAEDIHRERMAVMAHRVTIVETVRDGARAVTGYGTVYWVSGSRDDRAIQAGKKGTIIRDERGFWWFQADPEEIDKFP